MSFNKKIIFPEPPTSFSVRSVQLPPVDREVLQEKSKVSYEAGKNEASGFYLAEINQLKDQYRVRQNEILDQLNQRAEQVLSMLNDNLPDLVLEIVQKILPSIELTGSEIEANVRTLINEFADKDEKLEVYLCPEDLRLLKAMGKSSSPESLEDNEENNEDGFASAIAGIFDNLDGDDSILPDLPRVKFYEDSSLVSGDCQVKSKFGLLDGRISTKIRKIGEELKGNG